MDRRLERFQQIEEQKAKKRQDRAPTREQRIASVSLQRVTGHEAWDLYLAEIQRLRQTSDTEAGQLRAAILAQVRDPVETANLHARLHGTVGISSGLTLAMDLIYNLIAEGKSEKKSE